VRITVKNYRGCAEADLELAPIALVAGLNHAGKSSIAQAVAAALTRNPAIVEGVTKAGAEVLLRDGEKRGRCTVGDESGSVSANWPGASVSEDGRGPQASEIACGLVSLVGMKPKDAAAALIAAMSALPTLDDLRAACPGVRPELLDAVWKRIQSEGWDASAKRAGERSASLKGAWEQITGERWGVQKGAGWAAPGLPGADIDPQQEVAACRQALEDAIANQAANEAEVQRLQAEASKAQSRAATVANLEEESRTLNADVQRLIAEQNALPRPETAEQMVECPHCKGHLVVVSRTDVRAPVAGVTDEENQRRQAAIDAKREEVRVAQVGAAQVDSELREYRAALAASNRAQQQLDAMPTGTVTAEQVQAARNALRQADDWNVAVSKTAAAASRHAEIVENNDLVAALAPNGVRQTVLASKMSALRARLVELSAAAGWSTVELDDDLRVTLGGRAYGLLSASEQFRVRTVLQVALADLDGSDAVIIDAADILDRGGRNGLFSMLRVAGMRALVCMTMNDVKDVPDLSRASGLGRSYWIGGAVAAPVGGVTQPA